MKKTEKKTEDEAAVEIGCGCVGVLILIMFAAVAFRIVRWGFGF